MGVDNELLDAPLIHVDYVPDWYPRLVEFLMIGLPLTGMSKINVRQLLRLA